jgi:hypothetical protein
LESFEFVLLIAEVFLELFDLGTLLILLKSEFVLEFLNDLYLLVIALNEFLLDGGELVPKLPVFLCRSLQVVV